MLFIEKITSHDFYSNSVQTRMKAMKILRSMVIVVRNIFGTVTNFMIFQIQNYHLSYGTIVMYNKMGNCTNCHFWKFRFPFLVILIRYHRLRITDLCCPLEFLQINCWESKNKQRHKQTRGSVIETNVYVSLSSVTETQRRPKNVASIFWNTRTERHLNFCSISE